MNIAQKVKIAVVGCTGKLGSAVLKSLSGRTEAVPSHAITRSGSSFVGKTVPEIIGIAYDLKIIDDIELAATCDVVIDCTTADVFMEQNLPKYQKIKKPLVLAATAFREQDMKKLKKLALSIPIFMTGNFSITLHHFLDTLAFAASRITPDTDIQILEYHHNQKKDAPSGTAFLIRNTLIKANPHLTATNIPICSIRGGNIYGEHEVIFANPNDEIITFRHGVSSRKPFAEGAI